MFDDWVFKFSSLGRKYATLDEKLSNSDSLLIGSKIIGKFYQLK